LFIVRPEALCQLNIPVIPPGNRTLDLPAGSEVPCPTAPQSAPLHGMSDIKLAQVLLRVSSLSVLQRFATVANEVNDIKEIQIPHNQSMMFQHAPFKNTPFTPLFLVS
jgi:hypothetical protein